LAAAAVRTLASVAEYIPVNPARIEKSAPTRKAIAVYRSMKTAKKDEHGQDEPGKYRILSP